MRRELVNARTSLQRRRQATDAAADDDDADDGVTIITD